VEGCILNSTHMRLFCILNNTHNVMLILFLCRIIDAIYGRICGAAVKWGCTCAKELVYNTYIMEVVLCTSVCER
jgi:hypothetical protein